MASADWTDCTNNLSSGQVVRGVTNGVAPPNGGGSFVYGFNSLGTATGGVALFTNISTFAPVSGQHGGSVRGAIRRGLSGGPLNFSPFLFFGLPDTDVNSTAYMLGLADEDPHHIVLVKGALSSGVPAVLPQYPVVSGVLARSSAVYANDTWLHLRLDVIVNTNNDVLLQCWQNDLNAHTVTSPTWALITGTSAAPGQSMANFVDDALHVNSGTAPIVGGRAGFGFATKDVNRRAFLDQIEVARQT